MSEVGEQREETSVRRVPVEHSRTILNPLGLRNASYPTDPPRVPSGVTIISPGLVSRGSLLPAL